MPDAPHLLEPEWLRPGSPVAELQYPHHERPRLVFTTVARVTDLYVALANNERYDPQTLVRHVGGTWGHAVQLKPADDPEVRQVADDLALLHRIDAARTAAVRHGAGHTDTTSARPAAEALTCFSSTVVSLLAQRMS